MSSSPQRRLTHEESIGKLLNRLPGVEKVFQSVHVQRPGDTEYHLKATLPFINKKAWRNTINAYKLKVMAYNRQASIENRNIKKQVASGNAWLESQPREKMANILLIRGGFEGNNAQLNVWEYNKKVEAYNTMYGAPIIPKKRVQTIKQSTQQIFEALLWEYNKQLKELRLLRKGRSWYGTLPKMEVNTKHLENAIGEHKLPLLSCCPDTILNHKNRMLEAGILLNSEYRGSQRGTLHHISEEILCIFDDFDQKLICSENQLLMIAQPEEFRDAVIPTRAISKPIVKKGVDKPHPLDKDKALRPLDNARPTDDSTRAPMGKMKNPTETNRAENFNPEKKQLAADTQESTQSQKLAAHIENPADFAKKLSQKTAMDPNSINLEQLKQEAETGTMSRSDFRTLLLQLLFVRFSKLYLQHPHFDVIFPGLWLKTYQVWAHGRIFCNNNGELLQKETMLTHYRELWYCLENKQWGVLSWINKGTFVPANPFIYLNPSNPSKGTFVHHFYKVREKSPKAFTKIREVTATAKKDGEKYREYSKHLQRLNRKFAQRFNGKIGDTELLRYVRDNMPQAIQQNFQKHFDNYRNNKFKTS